MMLVNVPAPTTMFSQDGKKIKTKKKSKKNMMVKVPAPTTMYSQDKKISKPKKYDGEGTGPNDDVLPGRCVGEAAY